MFQSGDIVQSKENKYDSGKNVDKEQATRSAIFEKEVKIHKQKYYFPNYHCPKESYMLNA